MIDRRRLAVTLVLATSALVTIATSPPHTVFPGLTASNETRVLLDTAEPSFTTHLTVRLAAEQNGTAPDGGGLAASLSVSASGCFVGVDVIDDAGVCREVKDFSNRPALLVSVRPDGADAGLEDPQLVSQPLFLNCAVGSACSQGLTVTVSLARGEVRPTQVDLAVSASAQGGTVDRNATEALTITQP